MSKPGSFHLPIAPDAFRKISSDYILQKFRAGSELKNDVPLNFKAQFIERNVEIDLIRVLFDNSKNLLRMYGSPEEHTENLRVFRNFTTSYKYFGTTPTAPFYTVPLMYKSLKSGFFMVKRDLFATLESIAVRVHPDLRYGVYSAFLAFFIKMQVEKLNKTLEFVRIDNTTAENIAREFQIKMECCEEKSPQFPDSIPMNIWSGSISEFHKKVMEFFPGVTEEDDDYNTILHVLKVVYSRLPDGLRGHCFNSLLFVFETLVKCLNDIIKKHSEWFLPADITLRIFLHHQKSCWRVLGLRCDYCTGTEPFYENGRCEISIFAETAKDNSIVTCLTGGRPVYKPIPERFKTVLKSKNTEKIDAKTIENCEKIDRIICDVTKESEVEVEILREKLLEKEEEIVNFKRDALIHEKTVKGYKELKQKIAEYEYREKELVEEVASETVAHSKTILENEHLKRKIASFRSNLKDSIERIESEIDIRDKELEILARKIANYEVKQMNDESIRAEIEKESDGLKKEIESYEEEKQKNETTIGELSIENSNLKMRLAELEASEAQISEARSQDATTIEQLKKENQELKESNELYNSNFNSMNETIYRERQTFGTVQQQLAERISELERKLISRNQQENVENSDWMAEKRVLQEEIAEKTRQIVQVTESNVVLRTENEMNSRMVENLLDRLSGMSISSAVSQAPPPSGTSSWNRQNPTRDSELEDIECVICLIDINQRQTTIKCHQCRRRFHSKCASDWLKVKSQCPACRGRLLDPNELPSL